MGIIKPWVYSIQVGVQTGVKSDGTIGTKMSTVVTEKGREFLHNIINNNK